MLRSTQRFGGGGGFIDKMIPGYQEKIWKAIPEPQRFAIIRQKNRSFESFVSGHKRWQNTLTAYKASENGMAPSPKFRKISVDWRRQMTRGTMHVGRWYEGPPVPGSSIPSNYTPGNTYDRLQNVRAPFSEAEWEERKNYRSFDLVKFGYGLIGIFILFRLNGEWPVVWCEEKEE